MKTEGSEIPHFLMLRFGNDFYEMQKEIGLVIGTVLLFASGEPRVFLV